MLWAEMAPVPSLHLYLVLSWFRLWHFVQLLLFIIVKTMAQSRSTMRCLTTGDICCWQQPLPCSTAGLACSSPGLGPSPHSCSPPGGAGMEVGWQGWRSRDCRGWHSLNSVFLTSFLYLKFKMVRRKGVRMSLCTQLYPQDEIILTQCRQELWWASVWVVLMRCARFFSKKTSLPKSTG